MLSIRNLHASIQSENGTPQKILQGLNLEVNAGEIHAIMGPNGSGKSTLASVLAGREQFQVNSGEVLFEGKNLFEMSIEQRACAGIFLGFQYPVEIPGVGNLYFIRTALNQQRKARGLPEIDAMDFLTFSKSKMKLLEMESRFSERYVNHGFSGGEKKRNEILQMMILEPKLAILDEIDSGLDIDALRVIATGVNSMRSKNRSMILVTHYQRLLSYIEPDFVHVLRGGKIIRSGDRSLALELEKTGYSQNSDQKSGVRP